MLIFAIRCTVVITSPNKNSSANTIFTNFRQFILHADPPIGLFLASAVAESITGKVSILINGKSGTTRPFIVFIFCITAGA